MVKATARNASEVYAVMMLLCRVHIGVCFFEASGSRLEKRVKTVFFLAG